MHPLLEIVELWRPRLPLGVRAAFCSYCLCLSKHRIYDNPSLNWRRAVGSDFRDWARYQVCPVCQSRSPHRRRDRFVDPLTAENMSIEQLWEQTSSDERARTSVAEIERELTEHSQKRQRQITAMTGAAFALHDVVVERKRIVDKVMMTAMLFGSIVLLAIIVNWPMAIALLIALFPSAFWARMMAERRFVQRELSPMLRGFFAVMGISEDAFVAFVAEKRSRLSALWSALRTLRAGTPRSRLQVELHEPSLRAGIDYLAPPR